MTFDKQLKKVAEKKLEKTTFRKQKRTQKKL